MRQSHSLSPALGTMRAVQTTNTDSPYAQEGPGLVKTSIRRQLFVDANGPKEEFRRQPRVHKYAKVAPKFHRWERKYCEVCGQGYSCPLKYHLLNPEHMAVVDAPGFYSHVDDILGQLQSMETFLRSTTQTVHNAQGFTNDTCSSTTHPATTSIDTAWNPSLVTCINKASDPLSRADNLEPRHYTDTLGATNERDGSTDAAQLEMSNHNETMKNGKSSGNSSNQIVEDNAESLKQDAESVGAHDDWTDEDDTEIISPREYWQFALKKPDIAEPCSEKNDLLQKEMPNMNPEEGQCEGMGAIWSLTQNVGMPQNIFVGKKDQVKTKTRLQCSDNHMKHSSPDSKDSNHCSKAMAVLCKSVPQSAYTDADASAHRWTSEDVPVKYAFPASVCDYNERTTQPRCFTDRLHEGNDTRENTSQKRIVNQNLPDKVDSDTTVGSRNTAVLVEESVIKCHSDAFGTANVTYRDRSCDNQFDTASQNSPQSSKALSISHSDEGAQQQPCARSLLSPQCWSRLRPLRHTGDRCDTLGLSDLHRREENMERKYIFSSVQEENRDASSVSRYSEVEKVPPNTNVQKCEENMIPSIEISVAVLRRSCRSRTRVRYAEYSSPMNSSKSQSEEITESITVQKTAQKKNKSARPPRDPSQLIALPRTHKPILSMKGNNLQGACNDAFPSEKNMEKSGRSLVCSEGNQLHVRSQALKERTKSGRKSRKAFKTTNKIVSTKDGSQISTFQRKAPRPKKQIEKCEQEHSYEINRMHLKPNDICFYDSFSRKKGFKEPRHKAKEHGQSASVHIEDGLSTDSLRFRSFNFVTKMENQCASDKEIHDKACQLYSLASSAPESVSEQQPKVNTDFEKSKEVHCCQAIMSKLTPSRKGTCKNEGCDENAFPQLKDYYKQSAHQALQAKYHCEHNKFPKSDLLVTDTQTSNGISCRSSEDTEKENGIGDICINTRDTSQTNSNFCGQCCAPAFVSATSIKTPVKTKVSSDMKHLKPKVNVCHKSVSTNTHVRHSYPGSSEEVNKLSRIDLRMNCNSKYPRSESLQNTIKASSPFGPPTLDKKCPINELPNGFSSLCEVSSDSRVVGVDRNAVKSCTPCSTEPQIKPSLTKDVHSSMITQCFPRQVSINLNDNNFSTRTNEEAKHLTSSFHGSCLARLFASKMLHCAHEISGNPSNEPSRKNVGVNANQISIAAATEPVTNSVGVQNSYFHEAVTLEPSTRDVGVCINEKLFPCRES